MLRVLSMGWGVQSFTLAAMMALDELPRVDFIVHADTGHEMSSTYELRRKYEPWLGERGLKVVTVRQTNTDPVQTWKSATDGVPAMSISRSRR